jgi:hypothetical protein
MASAGLSVGCIEVSRGNDVGRIRALNYVLINKPTRPAPDAIPNMLEKGLPVFLFSP